MKIVAKDINKRFVVKTSLKKLVLKTIMIDKNYIFIEIVLIKQKTIVAW